MPGNLADLSALHEAGVFGFKCFLLDSGVEEFPHLSTDEFADAMAETARLGALMLVHAEDAGLIDDSRAHGTAYAGFLASRPPAAEERGDRRSSSTARGGPAAAPTSSTSAPRRRSRRCAPPARTASTCPSRPARTT